MKIVINTTVDPYDHALATVRAAYDNGNGDQITCPTCGARDVKPCRTKRGTRANRWHVHRSILVRNS